jgi:hypothetical protein
VDTKNLSPGTIIAIIAVAAGIAGYLIWRGTSVQTYNGPPINMGAAMQNAGKGPGPAAAPAPAPGGTGR